MAITFTVSATDGEARAGVLDTQRGGRLDTPAMLVSTYRGGPLNLLPDQLDSLAPEAAAVALNVLSL